MDAHGHGGAARNLEWCERDWHAIQPLFAGAHGWYGGGWGVMGTCLDAGALVIFHDPNTDMFDGQTLTRPFNALTDRNVWLQKDTEVDIDLCVHVPLDGVKLQSARHSINQALKVFNEDVDIIVGDTWNVCAFHV